MSKQNLNNPMNSLDIRIDEKPKHTPERWTYSRCECGDPACKSYFVSVTRSDGRVDLDQARLIAAAPEMLRALEQTLAYIESSELGPFHTVEGLLKRAIAKAREGTNES